MPATRSKRRRKPHPNRLKQLREAAGFTLEDAFKAIGATRSAISRWENGLSEPTVEFRKDAAAFYGITREELGAIVYGS